MIGKINGENFQGGIIMKIGDIVIKVGGYIPDIRIGIIINIISPIVNVMTADGYENWQISFVEVINDEDR